jgi:hypothetical protein
MCVSENDVEAAFGVLGLPRTAPAVEVKAAYRALMTFWHPDKHFADPDKAHRAEERAKDLNKAYAVALANLREVTRVPGGQQVPWSMQDTARYSGGASASQPNTPAPDSSQQSGPVEPASASDGSKSVPTPRLSANALAAVAFSMMGVLILGLLWQATPSTPVAPGDRPQRQEVSRMAASSAHKLVTITPESSNAGAGGRDGQQPADEKEPVIGRGWSVIKQSIQEREKSLFLTIKMWKYLTDVQKDSIIDCATSRMIEILDQSTCSYAKFSEEKESESKCLSEIGFAYIEDRTSTQCLLKYVPADWAITYDYLYDSFLGGLGDGVDRAAASYMAKCEAIAVIELRNSQSVDPFVRTAEKMKDCLAYTGLTNKESGAIFSECFAKLKRALPSTAR